MDYISMKAEQDRKERLESKNFLFVTVPSMENSEELDGISLEKQIQEFKSILNSKEDIEIYKIFKAYIKTKNMNILLLKAPNEWHKQVDKLYKEENNLICISCVENKFPPMDLYYTTKPQQLKDDFMKFYNNYSK